MPRVSAWVKLNKSTWDKQRHALAKPVEQILEQRAATVQQFAANDEQWVSWGRSSDRILSVTATVLDKLSPVELRTEGRVWSVSLSLSAVDYADLTPGPEVSLRFVHTLEQALAAISPKVDDPPPTHLGRSRRELEWLDRGGVDPGPGVATTARVRKPPGPMPESRFWSVIARTTDNRSGAFQLSWEQANRFTARMRVLVSALDRPEHRASAERSLGFVSDDVWEDVRAWLVAQGQEAYVQALADPEAIRAALDSLTVQDELSLGEQLLSLESDD
jgi:hypothetical protein